MQAAENSQFLFNAGCFRLLNFKQFFVALAKSPI